MRARQSGSHLRLVCRGVFALVATAILAVGSTSAASSAAPRPGGTPGALGETGETGEVREVAGVDTPPTVLDPARDAAPSDRPAAAPNTQAAQAGQPLTGLFRLTPGSCADGGTLSGSHFRMVQPGGSADEGPYVSNGDSPCDDSTITPLEPGRDGGLSTENLQPHPEPPFNGSGGGVADRITQPATFFGSGFAVATEDPDRQTGDATEIPTVLDDGSGNLSGQVSAFGVAYNTQFYNQGAPKPDGSTPGITSDGLSGTFDRDTGAFVIEWVSTIDGGAFNNFSGVWHLEGTFEPAAGSATSSGTPEGGETGGGDTQGAAPDTASDDTGAAAPADVAPESTANSGSEAGGELARTGPPLPTSAGLLLLAFVVVLAGRARRCVAA